MSAAWASLSCLALFWPTSVLEKDHPVKLSYRQMLRSGTTRSLDFGTDRKAKTPHSFPAFPPSAKTPSSNLITWRGVEEKILLEFQACLSIGREKNGLDILR